MPRVVPSQVVRLIERLYPRTAEQSRTSEPALSLNWNDWPRVRAIVDLADQIPDECLLLDGEDYAAYATALSALRTQVEIWGTRIVGMPPAIQGLGPLHPLMIVRDALLKCPDEPASQGAPHLEFIAEPAEQTLRVTLEQDVGAVMRAMANGEWKAATVLAGSVSEALLLWALRRRSKSEIDVAVATLRNAGKLDEKPKADLTRWRFVDMIRASEQLSILDEEAAKQADLARDFRNLIHPGAAERTRQICDRATAHAALAAMYLIIRKLRQPEPGV